MKHRELSNRIAALFPGRSLQGYVRWKVRVDPIYDGVLDALRDVRTPVIDIGCGVGLLAFFLREHGFTAPIAGVDFDERKIASGQVAARHYRDVELRVGDARDPLPAGHNAVVLDILHYFDSASQQRILANVARAVPPGGVVVIRQPLKDESWRYRFTKFVDALGRAIRWMRAEHLNYPTREEIVGAFAGYEADIRPLWGGMPYNTYLLVFRRS
ncbi:MAG TPA: class I SAM-dependent methyltransferase [Thermoanaerobaculia bacterium]|nr:class I SAM-dependent methyltransferase [Thermoanaerobaculia bacterium]